MISSLSPDRTETGAQPTGVEYHGLVLDHEGVAEWEDGRKAVFVRRDQLRALRYEFGWRSERPIAQGLLGATLLAAGLHVLRIFILAFIRDGMVSLPKTFTGLGIMLPILGAWTLFGALRRGHFLRADLVNGDSRKFLLQRRFDATEFAAFVARAQAIGYSIGTP
jgi:hypothetical protein